MELEEKNTYCNFKRRTSLGRNLYVNASPLSFIKVDRNEYEDLQPVTGCTTDQKKSKRTHAGRSNRLVYVVICFMVPLYAAAAAGVVVVVKGRLSGGEWNAWGPWGNCSATCDYGMKRRERSCTYPEPGIGVKYCTGEPVEYQTCKENSCLVGWSLWSKWTTFCLGCGGGMQYRSRICFNPSDVGQNCIGDPVQLQACNKTYVPGDR